MAIFLALLCSVTYGAGDFFGGSAARRVHPFAVGWASHTMVVVPIAVVAALVGSERVTGRDLGWGAIGGLLGEGALLALYAGLARGPMTIVAPTTALIAAAVPVVVGSIFKGERPSIGQWVGIALAMVAIVVISLSPGSVAELHDPEPDLNTPPSADSTRVVPAEGFNTLTLGFSIIAGFGFGMFFVALVSGRVASSLLLTLLVVTLPPFRRRVFTRNLWPTMTLITAAATFDLTANVFYLFAVRRGDLSIVAVLSSLYPASTVILANRFLKERLASRQVAGMGLAVAAVVLVAVG
jgi:drug/metabolite transporter (DMT)-like permease